MTRTLLVLAAFAMTSPALAQESREMDAHVHGVSTAKIAVDHGTVEIDILSPGMDIVGFEYPAASDAEKDAVAAAVRTLLIPENIVTLPQAAGCRLTGVLAHLHGGSHGHGDEHAGEEGHDHEDHEDHEDHADAHGHDEGAGEHSEFHVRYGFSCADEDALTTVGFPFFDQFENAQEIEAEFVTETGAGAAEIDRGEAELSLR